MWILQFLPNWIFYLLLLASIGTFLVTKFLTILPQAKLIQVASIMLAAFSIYMIGAISNNDAWLARVKDLEVKVAEAEAKSANANTDIVQKTLVKTQIVRERGQDIVRYVDREIIKYDATCIIPKEFVTAHNKAAESPKK